MEDSKDLNVAKLNWRLLSNGTATAGTETDRFQPNWNMETGVRSYLAGLGHWTQSLIALVHWLRASCPLADHHYLGMMI